MYPWRSTDQEEEDMARGLLPSGWRRLGGEEDQLYPGLAGQDPLYPGHSRFFIYLLFLPQKHVKYIVGPDSPLLRFYSIFVYCTGATSTFDWSLSPIPPVAPKLLNFRDFVETGVSNLV